MDEVEDIPTFNRFLTMKREDNVEFFYLSLFRKHEAIKAVLIKSGKNVDVRKMSLQKTRKGDIMIRTNCDITSRALEDIKQINGQAAKIEPHPNLNMVHGVASHDMFLEMSETEIKTILQEYDNRVVGVYKFPGRPDVVKTTQTIKISFWAHRRPRNVTLGWGPISVRAYTERIKQCQRCWKLGHLTKECRKETDSCKHCRMTKHEGTCVKAVSCTNCEEEHSADSKECEARKLEERIMERCAENYESYFEAKNKLKDNSKEGSSFASVVASNANKVEKKIEDKLDEVLSQMKEMMKTMNLILASKNVAKPQEKAEETKDNQKEENVHTANKAGEPSNTTEERQPVTIDNMNDLPELSEEDFFSDEGDTPNHINDGETTEYSETETNKRKKASKKTKETKLGTVRFKPDTKRN